VTVLDSRTPAVPAQAAASEALALARDPELRLAALFDPGTLHLLTRGDDSGALAATGSIDGMPAVAFASDPRVQGGAMGTADCAAIVGRLRRGHDPGRAGDRAVALRRRPAA